jgi:hypothetical protein
MSSTKEIKERVKSVLEGFNTVEELSILGEYASKKIGKLSPSDAKTEKKTVVPTKWMKLTAVVREKLKELKLPIDTMAVNTFCSSFYKMGAGILAEDFVELEDDAVVELYEEFIAEHPDAAVVSKKKAAKPVEEEEPKKVVKKIVKKIAKPVEEEEPKKVVKPVEEEEPKKVVKKVAKKANDEIVMPKDGIKTSQTICGKEYITFAKNGKLFLLSGPSMSPAGIYDFEKKIIDTSSLYEDSDDELEIDSDDE